MEILYRIHTPLATVVTADPNMAEFWSRQGSRVTSEVR